MQQKAFSLLNRGMNRDLSISKVGESAVFENHNIRILARDHDTLLSVTNERGNKAISLSPAIEGTLLGWNVLNKHLVLFTTTTTASVSGVDRIYRVDYDGANFANHLLFQGNLNFRPDNPIESIMSFETENIQKIYWVDGKNVLRMMNFVDSTTPWYRNGVYDNTYFDSDRIMVFSASVEITKDNSGNIRPNGVAQYFLTYYNKHGQESGFAWISDLVYLSPVGVGGGSDTTNNNKVTLKLSNLDNRFSNYRIYSIFRSSYDGTVVANIVFDGLTPSNSSEECVVIDDYAHQEAMDATKLLFVGSQHVLCGTLTQKDQTLFLGDLNSIGRGAAYAALETAIQNTRFTSGSNWESAYISFDYSSDADASGVIPDIPAAENDEVYSYRSQLEFSSSQILSFKGGEKYRFGLQFRNASGITSETFWIGDKINLFYPINDATNKVIKRIIAKCTIPASADEDYDVVGWAKKAGYVSAQLMIAEATYADRSIKAQGILNPTVFNVWNRYNGRLYAAPSWTSRPRNAGFANHHFEVTNKSGLLSGEIECSYWEKTTPTPYYRLKNYGTANEDYDEEFDGIPTADYYMLIYQVYKSGSGSNVWYQGAAMYITAELNGATEADLEDFIVSSLLPIDDASYEYNDPATNITFRFFQVSAATRIGYSDLCTLINRELINSFNVNRQYFVTEQVYNTWGQYFDEHPGSALYWKTNYSDVSKRQTSLGAAIDYYEGTKIQKYEAIGQTWEREKSGNYTPSYYKKHLMFVDENVLSFESPEIAHEAVSFDRVEGFKLRIVGVATVSGRISDSTVDATHGLMPGQNLANDRFSGAASTEDNIGLLSYPMWQEYGLIQNSEAESFDEDIKKRTSEDYEKGSGMVRYWMYMFSKGGVIDGFQDTDVTIFDGDNYSRLDHKVFGNLRYTDNTIFNNNRLRDWSSDVSLRIFNQTSSQYTSIEIGETTKYYDGYVDDVLTMPGDMKFPILYSTGNVDDTTKTEIASGMYLFSQSPVPITYGSAPHAVVSLPTSIVDGKYKQTILPGMFQTDFVSTKIPEHDTTVTGALIPWVKQSGVEVLVVCSLVNLPSLTLDSFSEDTMTATMHWRITDINQENMVRRWETESVQYGTVYARVLAQGTYFIIDVSKTEQRGDDLYLIGADVLAFQELFEEDVIVRVHQIQYDSSWDRTDSGVLNINVGNGQPSGSSDTYTYTDYDVQQDPFELSVPQNTHGVDPSRPYFFIGELYQDFDVNKDYGGISESAIEANRFIPAGPYTNLGSGATLIYGNQGDTYFQRWDDFRIKPLRNDDVNSVVDVVSVMLESHINLDGRYDNLRGNRYLASMDYEKFGTINPVYSQRNNFMVGRDLDEDFNLDSYRSSITWSLEKKPSAEIDEWTHVTLADSLELDGDKGHCQCLHRFQNSILAFQDRGIAEVMFNSRTQLSTNDGVPVEIANSGKVDGKRYISNKYGCTNKWSITEGKKGLYFIDNINKAFCSFNGEGIENLSTKLGFGAWFRKMNTTSAWTPAFGNFASFYDRVHSDIYLVSDSENEPCLVYSEVLDAFSSFYDYRAVPMMTNIEDRFVSFKNGLWLQNEGLYGNFFGTQYGFGAKYRVTPDPYGDKVWTNLEYRADFYKVLNADGSNLVTENDLIDGGDYTSHTGDYQPNKTFDNIEVWNEYQTTGSFSTSNVEKKFRIWRYVIPRAVANVAVGNKYGLDRIRNPWINLKFFKAAQNVDGKDLVQLHDVVVKYFE